jgi:hypothetical protein
MRKRCQRLVLEKEYSKNIVCCVLRSQLYIPTQLKCIEKIADGGVAKKREEMFYHVVSWCRRLRLKRFVLHFVRC